jgi:hypothetical protein
MLFNGYGEWKMLNKLQRDNYVHLVARVLTEELPCLQFLTDVAVSHISIQRYETEDRNSKHFHLLTVDMYIPLA